MCTKDTLDAWILPSILWVQTHEEDQVQIKNGVQNHVVVVSVRTHSSAKVRALSNQKWGSDLPESGTRTSVQNPVNIYTSNSCSILTSLLHASSSVHFPVFHCYWSCLVPSTGMSILWTRHCGQGWFSKYLIQAKRILPNSECLSMIRLRFTYFSG